MSKILRGVLLRNGTKEIFAFCKQNGWEIWIYTTSFRSPLYIRKIFWLYGISLNGVVNQERHNKEVKAKSSKHPPTFGIDWLIDDSKGVEIEGKRYGFNVIQIEPNDVNWVETIKSNLRNK